MARQRAEAQPFAQPGRWTGTEQRRAVVAVPSAQARWAVGQLVMRTVGLAEAKAQLSALLDAVQAGEEVVITRRG